jgi:nitrite reductase/ring-hydroxylating ferredoxin subunit
MLARWLTRLMDAQGGWTRPLGDLAHRFLFWFFQAMPAVRDLLVGRWLGHPLHAVLTDAPIGILFLVIVFDVLGNPGAATVTLAVGILAMLAAALAGFADYADTDGRARERATLHATLMLTALLLYLVSLVARLGAGSTVSNVGIWFSILAFLVLAIPEGRLVKAKLGINQLVLVRQGEQVLALHDTCAHAGGPLNEGKLLDGNVVECPWHFSRYRMSDGLVLRGPSVYDQPAYEVRRREGGGWEARRRG